MDYIAVLDYEHLDNGAFLTSFARSLGEQKQGRGIIIHGDSTYTERLIQSGIMRDDAVIRAVKDLNHRLIALFADNGVAAIGLNAYQRSMVRLTGDRVEVDKQEFQRLPSRPHLLISNLVDAVSGDRPRALDLSKYASVLSSAFEIDDIFVFSKGDSAALYSDEQATKENPSIKHPGNMNNERINRPFRASLLPDEFKETDLPVRLTSTRSFANYPIIKDSN